MKRVLTYILLGLMITVSTVACDLSQKCPGGVCNQENSPQPAPAGGKK